MSRAADLRLLERTGALFAQLFFIAAGVYLGNRADAWKEERNHREAARAALVNFRAEITKNDSVLGREMAYRARLARGFAPFMQEQAHPPASLDAMFSRAGWNGFAAVPFRHTAWDVALADQSLTYLDQRLAFAIADVYLAQQRYDEFQLTTQRAALNPASLRPESLGGLGMLLAVYYNDTARSNDPQLAAQYHRVLPRIDSAIARLSR